MVAWYEELFKDYARTYEKQPYVQGTMGEVDFLEQEMNYDKSKRILDIGCGTGRHAIELAKRGYTVTGVDLSISQLTQAREQAKNQGVFVEFTQKDARQLDYQQCFDVVIMLCEGAFSLMETDEMNFKILQNAAKALRTPGKLIFTTLNALFPLYHSVKDFLNANANAEDFNATQLTFDIITLRESATVEIVDDNGQHKMLHCNERYYMPSEINWYLESLQFKQIAIHGCRLGQFSRQDKLTPSDFEMLVIAEKL